MSSKKDLFDMVFDALPQGLLVIDRELKIKLGNKRARALFQRSEEQLSRTPISSLIPHKNLPRLIAEAAEEGEHKAIELHRDSDRQHSIGGILQVTILPLQTNPANSSLLVVLEDVTEKVMLEEQLVQAEKLAAMGQLAQGIAHEVGNPLSSMSSTLQYIRESLAEEGNGALVEAVEVSLDNLNQMHELLHSLTEFTRTRRPCYESTNLHQLIRESLRFISREAEKHKIRLFTSFDPFLPFCQIDVRQIKQVLLNLFKNAMEAMQGGGRLSVKTRLGTLGGQDTQAAVVKIQDTGLGIGRNQLRDVFRPLYSTKPKGTGLGLSFCREVTEAHGGEIRLSSQNNKGTTVTLILPLHQKAMDE